MKNRSLLIGEQSLLVQCGNALLDQAFSIGAVIARNPIIVDWARDKGIACFVSEREWLATKGEQDSQPFDYLFSITNLRVLSKEILAVPTRMAINFHDGPLPKYAGLNTPVWALLAGEQEYGISWHVMASDVDAGDILKQQFFPVVPGETVFTLNAKCYQAGLDSFTELITELANDTLSDGIVPSMIRVIVAFG